ncbi:MAG: hypothetical protein C5B54_05150 [Acidobacteria bacterium]|nr:MAG: hypothetical protein C5B54_05150 [Acidobacteriota bacterium]
MRDTGCAILLIMAFALNTASAAVPTIDDQAIARLPQQADTVVVNFWATWCAPCIEEIPIFVRLHKNKPNIQIVGISMDNLDQQGVVDKFAKEKRMTYQIVLRQGKNFENMVNSLDPNWNGGIPATFVFHKGKRIFSKEGQITEKELLAALEQVH